MNRPGARMLVRVLLVGLVLAGQVPVRVCTCAAVHAAPEPGRTDAHRPIDQDHAPGCRGCCRHETDHDQHPGLPDEIPAAVGQASDDGGRHHPDCPAVNPRSVPTAALTVSVHVPDAAAELIAPPAPFSNPAPATIPATPIRSPPGGPPVPLYISLLVLRN